MKTTPLFTCFVRNTLRVLAVCTLWLILLSAPRPVSAQGSTLINTFTNPSPVVGEYFSFSAAAVGSDKVLIGSYLDSTGASSSGVAYLYSTNGAMLLTYTNPTPVAGDGFGYSVAAVGTNRVVIGAISDNTGSNNAGAAYIYDLTGTLLTTITNPTPFANDAFGNSVAAVGTDKVVIGAYLENTGSTDAGAAYLFNLTGTLLRTYTNPVPLISDNFGHAVAGVGTNKVLIGAYASNRGALDAGAAYLFDLNGNLVATYTNPAPFNSDYFGWSVAGVGDDKALIGAASDDLAFPDAGAAYLYDVNGNLLTTFTNPPPYDCLSLGTSVAALGTNRVIIGAARDVSGGLIGGRVHIFDLNGVLLTTITNPTPALQDTFGTTVAGVGTNLVLVGDYLDDTGASDAGRAYLFNLSAAPPTAPPPVLKISWTNANTLVISWPFPSTGFNLKQNSDLTTTNWVSPPETENNDGAIRYILVDPSTEGRYFRLFKP